MQTLKTEYKGYKIEIKHVKEYQTYFSDTENSTFLAIHEIKINGEDVTVQEFESKIFEDIEEFIFLQNEII
jgi:hypothetical protein